MNSNNIAENSDIKILVVDDDKTCRLAVKSILENFSYNVFEANNGSDALVQLQNKYFNVVVVDLEMPEMNGYRLIGSMRAQPKLKHIPAIVLTTKVDHISIERALIAGATSFLSKPLNWLAFGAHIEHIVSLSAVANQSLVFSREKTSHPSV